jgi:ribonuclease HII
LAPRLHQKGVIEQSWLDQGILPAGVDEVGRGCIAGPVVAGCVVLDYNKLRDLDSVAKYKIRDSKTLSEKQREEILAIIMAISTDAAIGLATEREIESLGILNATFLAMHRAINSIKKVSINIVLVDGNQTIRGLEIKQQPIVKGDSLCYTIAAASIMAKNYRDQLMKQNAIQNPQWGFERHVGYGTSEHIEAIHKYGICPLHRRNFAPIKDMTLNLN